MYTASLFVLATCAVSSLANPTPDMSKRWTKMRLTQFADHECKSYDDFQVKAWEISKCVDLDGQTNSFNLALGDASVVIAFAETGCPEEARMGVLRPNEKENPNTGACVDANFYLINEPTHYGSRINSIRFV